MKKKLLIIPVITMAALVFTGCTISKSTSPEATTEAKQHEASEPEGASNEELLKTMDLDIDQYVTLPKDYLNVEVPVKKEEYSEKGFNEYIDSMLQDVPIIDQTNKEVVEDGDVIAVEYKMTFRNKLEQDKEEEYLRISSSDSYPFTSFANNVQTELVGKKVGEEFTLKTKVFSDEILDPEDPDADREQKEEVTYTGRIKYIGKERKYSHDNLKDSDIPAIMSHLFFDQTTNTVEGFRKYMKETYEEELQNRYDTEVDEAIWKYLEDNTKITVPKDVRRKVYEKMAKQNNMSYEEFMKSATELEWISLDDLIKDEFLRYALIKDTHFEVTPEMVEESYPGAGEDGLDYEDLYGPNGKDSFLLDFAAARVKDHVLDVVRENAGINPRPNPYEE